MAEQKVKKRLSEVAYEQIKSMIVNNIYRQGMMLSEKQLCATLNMSRTPVREAIHMLVTEGFLVVRDGVGTFVKEQSQKDIEDAYEVRRVLEVLAVQTSMYRFTDEELDDLEAMFLDIQRRYHSHDGLSIEEYADADWKFHDMIVRKSENEYVEIVIAPIRMTLQRYQQMSVSVIADVESSLNDHLEIIQCLRRRDKEKLIQLLEQHICYT